MATATATSGGAPDAGDGRHELLPGIIGALSLPCDTIEGGHRRGERGAKGQGLGAVTLRGDVAAGLRVASGRALGAAHSSTVERGAGNVSVGFFLGKDHPLLGAEELVLDVFILLLQVRERLLLCPQKLLIPRLPIHSAQMLRS